MFNAGCLAIQNCLDEFVLFARIRLMENIERFNDYTIRVIGILYKSFPIVTNLDVDTLFDSSFKELPESPMSLGGRSLMSNNGVYVDPLRTDFDFLDRDKADLQWEGFGWGRCQREAETLLSRDLPPQELTELRGDGVRPLLPQ